VPTPTAASDDPLSIGRAILSWSRGVMANYKVPRSVVLVDALPVNASGKVLKRELRQRHEDGADAVITNES
jgi:acyl-CoA synthetase (AMP-forming)/AMP-acid ligase II